MKVYKGRALFSLLVLLSACGRQLVEFPKADAGGTDTKADVPQTQDVGGGNDAPQADAIDAPRIDAPVALDAIDAPRIDAAVLDAIDAPGIDAAALDAIDAPRIDSAVLDAIDAPRFDAAVPDAIDAPRLDAPLDAIDATGVDVSGVDLGSLDAGDAGSGAPRVILTNPLPLAMDVSTRKILTATFSEPMAPASINMLTFVLHQGTTLIPGAVSYSAVGTIATFVPMNDLGLNMIYIATVTTGVTDAAGNPMLLDYSWTFTTSACGQAPVLLGAADGFAVLAGPTVTNSGLTTVTGDLGTFPGTAIAGFGPGVVVGTQHPGDVPAMLAQGALTAAYNNAAGRTLCPVSVAGNLGGQTLTPGLYKSTDSLEISSGDLTLDAEGDPNAIFIFQMASTLVTTTGRLVVLTGLAKATNIFWQVGTSATLGGMTVFQGTIMANQSIVLNTGAVLNGRALARIAGITLDTSTVTRPPP